eukprot:6212850-Pleurochrysis_carterae.AAC.10
MLADACNILWPSSCLLPTCQVPHFQASIPYVCSKYEAASSSTTTYITTGISSYKRFSRAVGLEPSGPYERKS